MQTAFKIKTRVLLGKRIEFTAPELTEGTEVEIFVALPEEARVSPSGANTTQGVWDYIQSRPPVQCTPEEWQRVEREFQEERDSSDR